MERYLPVFCFCLGTANVVFALGALVFRHFRNRGLRTGRALMFLISGILFIVCGTGLQDEMMPVPRSEPAAEQQPLPASPR